MSTRRDILIKARQFNGMSPDQRQSYCSKCSENARQTYSSIIFPGMIAAGINASAMGLLGSLGPALVAQMLLGCPKTYGNRFGYQSDSGSAESGIPPGNRESYGVEIVGLNKESKPFTERGAQNAPVRLEQPKKQRNFMRDRNSNQTSGVNPDSKNPGEQAQRKAYASTGPKKMTIFERYVQNIKAKNKPETGGLK